MKKTLWIAIVGALAASVIAASAQTEVLSGNAVGYVKVDIASQLTMINVPFDDMSDVPVMFTNAIGTQVSGLGATLYAWNGLSWDSYSWKTRGGWSDAAGLILEPGKAYFLQRPDSWSGTSNITLTGEVPMATNTARTVTGAGNLNTISFSYPVSIPFTNTFLAVNGGGLGATLYAWNGLSWDSYSWKTRGGWADAAAVNMEPGLGYFFKAADAGAGFTWSQVRPYTWPGPAMPASAGPF